MTKFGEPPSAEELRTLGPELEELPSGTELWRLYFRGGERPRPWSEFRTYGPTSSRFDHQIPENPPRFRAIRPETPPPARGILYAALQARTCFAEVFQDTRRINVYANRPWLVGFQLVRPIRLLNLPGLWPTRTGRASTVISNGPRPRAQRWSQAIYEAFPEVEGLLYSSAMDGGAPAIALYERAQDALPRRPTFHRSLEDPGLEVAVENAATDLGYGIDLRPEPSGQATDE